MQGDHAVDDEPFDVTPAVDSEAVFKGTPDEAGAFCRMRNDRGMLVVVVRKRAELGGCQRGDRTR